MAAPISVLPDNLTGRQALRDLVLVGYGREEDVRLLQELQERSTELALSTVQQVLMECGFREEYRRQRESTLLETLHRTGLSFIESDVQLQQTMQQLQQLQDPPPVRRSPSPSRASSPTRRQGPKQGAPRAGSPGAGANRPPKDPIYNEMMARLQRLHLALKTHVAEDGPQGARVALDRHISDAQASFDRALLAIQQLVEGRRDPEAPLPPLSLRFGHLGSTMLDQQRVESFRRHRAARCIQRAYRARLDRKDWARRLQLGEELRLTNCARRIQRAVRRMLATQRRREATVEQIRQHVAAYRIQRWYRQRRKVRRAQAAAAVKAREAGATRAAVYRSELERRVQESRMASTSSEPEQWKAAVTIQRHVRGHLARKAAGERRRAVVTLQRFVRGYLCRRRGEMYWKHTWRELRLRRHVQAEWEAQKRSLAVSITVYAALSEGWLQSNAVQSSLATYMRTESDRFERNWRAFEAKVTSEALKKPLPKHWIPQLDPITGETIYIYTKEGTLHKTNPHLAKVKPFLVEQQKIGREQLGRQLVEAVDRADAVKDLWLRREEQLFALLQQKLEMLEKGS